MGTGYIAAEFAKDLALLEDADLVAVASRDTADASRFAAAHGVPRSYGTYGELLADPDIDAVYIATIQSAHHDVTLLALQSGKPTLVEKPFTVNAEQAFDVISAAQKGGVFLMEAMWTRFVPHIVDLRMLLSAGGLGDVRTVIVDHADRVEDGSQRIFDPLRAGGALLDLGVYCVSFASMVLGSPSQIAAVGCLTNGVDSQTSAVLSHANGSQAVLTTSLEAKGTNRAAIIGTEARVEIDGKFYVPSSFSVIWPDGRTERHGYTRIGQGLRYQAHEVARCVRAGLVESPAMPLLETLQIMRTMDQIRSQIGVVYPDDHRQG
ncbi:hypothetical protein ASC63_03150 [Leifsonia sp. Root112D2]|nr:hypothetical protein ASC63_03150 [Leifsonia sp. Root112D2]